MALSYGNFSLGTFLAAYASGTKAAVTGFEIGSVDVNQTWQMAAGDWASDNVLGFEAISGNFSGQNRDLGFIFQSINFSGLTMSTASFTGGGAHGTAFNFTGTPGPGGWVSGYTPPTYHWTLGGTNPTYFGVSNANIANPTFSYLGTAGAGTWTCTATLTITDSHGRTSATGGAPGFPVVTLHFTAV